MELTREEAIRNFREHWASLAITGTKDKTEFLKRHGFPEIRQNCFLCEIAGRCDKCPIEWPKTRDAAPILAPCAKSYYGDWDHADTPEKRSRLAALIRDLPEKAVEKKEEAKAEKWVPKVGDRVRIRLDLEVESYYDNGCRFAPGMDKYLGKTAIISDIAGPNRFYLRDIHWAWSTSMLEPAPRFQIGDKVVPVSKTALPGTTKDDLINSDPHWTEKGGEEQGFLYIARYSSEIERKYLIPNNPLYVCNISPGRSEGEYYFESDLIPYVEPEKKPETPQYKPGDRVKVKTDLVVYQWYGHIQLLSGKMESYRGQTTTITAVEQDSRTGAFGFNIAGNEYYWSEAMLEPAPVALKVGDRVRLSNPCKIGRHIKAKGKIGTIVHIDNDFAPYGVDFGEDINGVTLFGRLSGDHGLWCTLDELELLPPANHCPEPKTITLETITAKFKGAKTTVTIENENGRFIGITKCSPDDTWDEKKGVAIALSRATAKQFEAVAEELSRS